MNGSKYTYIYSWQKNIFHQLIMNIVLVFKVWTIILINWKSMSLNKLKFFLTIIAFSGIVNGIRRTIKPDLNIPFYTTGNSIFGTAGVFGSPTATNGNAGTTNNVQGNQGIQSANITNSLGVANVQTNNQINTVVNTPVDSPIDIPEGFFKS